MCDTPEYVSNAFASHSAGLVGDILFDQAAWCEESGFLAVIGRALWNTPSTSLQSEELGNDLPGIIGGI